MPRNSNRSAFSALSVALAVCAAAAATAGCGRADAAAAPPAAAHGATAVTRAPSPSTSAPPGKESSATPQQDNQATTPSAPRSPEGKPVQGKRDQAAARTVAVKPEGLAKLPVDKSLDWKPDGPLSSQDLKGQKITLNECVAVAGATQWQQQGYLSAARNSAGQQLLFFPDSGSAKGAYDRLVAQMNDCQATSRGLQAREGVPQDAVVSNTATVKDGSAWSRHWTGIGRDVQTNHLYAVLQGDHLTLFQFDELAERPAPPHDTGTDAAVLGALADLGAPN
ncbi:hypothetical protein [Streptomyces sp. NPDC096339]|uniref:hypothetical protein n=1 Tax=Streptomyces sp. NPDC096339 TaxID=3366086 RepID=UPI003808B882